MKWYEKIVNWLRRYRLNKVFYSNLKVYFERINSIFLIVVIDYNKIKNKQYFLDIFFKKNYGFFKNLFRNIFLFPIFFLLWRFISYFFFIFLELYRNNINLFFNLLIDYMPIHAKKYGILYKKRVIFDLNKTRKAFLYTKFFYDINQVFKSRDKKVGKVIQYEFFIFRIFRIFFSVIYLIIKEMPVFFSFLSFFFRFFIKIFRIYLKYLLFYFFRYLVSKTLNHVHKERLKTLGFQVSLERTVHFEAIYFKFLLKYVVFKLKKFEINIFLKIKLYFNKLYKYISIINWIKSFFKPALLKKIKGLLKIRLKGWFIIRIPIFRKWFLKKNNFKFLNKELSNFVDKNDTKSWLHELDVIDYEKILKYTNERKKLLLLLKFYEIIAYCYYLLLLPQKYIVMPYQILYSIFYFIKLVVMSIYLFFRIIYRMIFKLK